MNESNSMGDSFEDSDSAQKLESKNSTSEHDIHQRDKKSTQNPLNPNYKMPRLLLNEIGSEIFDSVKDFLPQENKKNQDQENTTKNSKKSTPNANIEKNAKSTKVPKIKVTNPSTEVVAPDMLHTVGRGRRSSYKPRASSSQKWFVGSKQESKESDKGNESDDSMIKAFCLNIKDGLEEDEEIEQISELEAYVKNIESNELQTELPRRIFNASRVVAQKISKLEKDEYGDYMYKEDDLDDAASQKLKKASEVLKFWLDKLKKINEMEEMMKKNNKNEMKDKETQVDLDSTIFSPAKESSPSFRKLNKKKESSKLIPGNTRTTPVLKRMATKVGNGLGIKKVRNLEKKPTIKGTFSSHVTTAKPFQFNIKLKNKLPKQVKI